MVFVNCSTNIHRVDSVLWGEWVGWAGWGGWAGLLLWKKRVGWEVIFAEKES